MEKVKYPESLIYPDSKIKIYYEDKIQVNKTRTSIIVEGNPNGFLSLSNIINVYSVYLYTEIVVSEFSFVNSKIKFEIVEDSKVSLEHGEIVQENKQSFTWKISEINLCVIICMLHSLGYANNEIHFDTNLKFKDISVYCVVK